ncbi:MAG: beta-lysylation protein EpmB [Gammaproteobacteria bacterium]|jgi:EF-P beta-lysylation protein EpmB|nr:beta-lysylation protein EpmB [Gammaproteobacteria bacterium]
MTTDWQKSLSNLITDPKELCHLLELDVDTFISQHAINEFPLRVPRRFVSRMEKGNPQDPLLKQVLPIAPEMQLTSGYSQDPLEENNANPIPGLLHKYHGRLLLLVSGGCAINCRYCFRRHFPYNENAPGTQGWDRVIDYIQKDNSISEVIYSGGDPLVAKDDMLASLTQKIASIPHVSTLRIHTRLPIVIPERITASLLSWFTQTRLRPVLVTHANHPNEIDHHVMAAIQRLRQAGVIVLNQSVLLRGINDEVETLVHLSQKLFEAGALPYYLHMLDSVQGAAHFAVPVEEAKKLILEMSFKLPGYLLPKLVREKPGVLAKCPV